VPGAAELQRFQKLPVIGLFAQLYLERQSHFSLRVKPDGIVLDVQHEAVVASLFSVTLGVSLEVKRQQPFGFPLFGRDLSQGAQLQIVFSSENYGFMGAGPMERPGAFKG
jgi:hypothetical protein